MTGKELKYVHVLIEHDVDKDAGEFIQLYVIPASSKKAVEKEIIESDMPIKMINLLYNSEIEEYELGKASGYVTASLNKPDGAVLAKK